MRKTLSLVCIAAGCGLLAASALASARQSPPPNTFRWSLTVDIDYVDPALAYYVPTWALEYATGALLFNYPDAPAPRGTRLAPEVAAGFPTISRDGRTYTFRLRKGLRLSNGESIEARNFVWALHRVMNRRMSSPAQPFVEDIVGAKGVFDGRTARASGIRVLDRHTLRIRLTRRAPDLLARLAMPFFMAVSKKLPLNPDGVSAPVHAGGPYYIKSWTRNRSVVLERNPFYRGPRRRNVERIEVDVGLPLETIKRNVDRGATDTGDVPLAAHAELGRAHGARRTSPGRYFVNPSSTIWYLALNHRRPLFQGPTRRGNVALKRAINLAIDRVALISQWGAYGGLTQDQLLPSTVPGYRDAAIYPRRPAVERARALASGNTRVGKAALRCPNRRPVLTQCELVQAQLRQIGLTVEIQSHSPIFPMLPPPFDLSLETSTAAYLDPYEYVKLVDGSRITQANSVNASNFDDPGYNVKIRRARVLGGAARFAAFRRLDAELMKNAAPVAVFGAQNDRRYVSERTGCVHYHPVYGLDIPAICLR